MPDKYHHILQGIKTKALALTHPESREKLRAAFTERDQAEDCFAKKDNEGFVHHLSQWVSQMLALELHMNWRGLKAQLRADWPEWFRNLPRARPF